MRRRTLTSYLDMRQMPTGRRIWTCRRIAAEAIILGEAEIVEAAKAAIQHDLKTLVLERTWRGVRNKPSRARGNAQQIDRQIDARLASIHSIVNGFASGTGKGPEIEAAKKIGSKIFPVGVRDIITLAFEEQHEEVGSILDLFEGSLANEVVLLSLGGPVGELRSLHTQFGEELKRFPVEEVTWNKVSAAVSDGHEKLAASVVKILGRFSDDDPDTVEIRELLLAEYNRQQELVLESQRRRRTLRDVDHETGEELDESADAQGDSTEEPLDALETGS